MALTPCKSCKKEVSTDAKTCPHCGTRNPGGRTSVAAILGLSLLALLVVGYCSSLLNQPGDAPNTGGRTVAVTPDSPVLEVQSWGWAQEYDYAVAEGEVTNISGEPIRSAQAIVSYYDQDGKFVTSDDGMLKFNPILPGQTSPFKVMTTWNPAMKTARLQFKRLFGESLPARTRTDSAR